MSRIACYVPGTAESSVTKSNRSLLPQDVQGTEKTATEDVIKATQQCGMQRKSNGFPVRLGKSQFCCVALGKLLSCSVLQIIAV